MTRISVTSVVGRTESTTSAKISVGIDISRSTKRDSSVSNQPPNTAAEKPSMTPSEKESAVAERGDEEGDAGAIDHARQADRGRDCRCPASESAEHRLPDVADDLGHRRWGAISGAKTADQHEQRGQHQADPGAGMGMRLRSSMRALYFGCLSRGLATIAAMSAMMLRLM